MEIYYYIKIKQLETIADRVVCAEWRKSRRSSLKVTRRAIDQMEIC